MASQIRKYLTQDMNKDEKLSYTNYIKGDENSTEWIEKALVKRDQLLVQQLTCSQCNGYIGIWEFGLCKCPNNHLCYDVVLEAIKNM